MLAVMGPSAWRKAKSRSVKIRKGQTKNTIGESFESCFVGKERRRMAVD